MAPIGPDGQGSMEHFALVRGVDRMPADPFDAPILLYHVGYAKSLANRDVREGRSSLQQQVVQVIALHDEAEGNADRAGREVRLRQDTLAVPIPHSANLRPTMGEDLRQEPKLR